MAAGLGFKDFVTGEVLTAADVDGYLMQGIWVFDDAAARDAAVTSPQEGNACYLKDTNEVLTYSGSVWVAVSAAGGMTLLSTTTLSGATTTISVSATGYENLFVQVTGVNQSSNGAFRLAINGDTSITQSIMSLNYTAGLQEDGNNLTFYPSHSIKTGNTDNIFTYNIYNVTSTSSHKTLLSIFGYTDGSDRLAMDWGGGVYRSNSAITSLVFSPASGTFSAGTVKVYGVK
jgi:hypothetical protein